MVNAIPQHEIELMSRYMDMYATRKHMPVHDYLQPWADAKSEYLRKIFNNELIVRETIEIERSVDLLMRELDARLCEGDLFDFFYDIEGIVNCLAYENGQRWGSTEFAENYSRASVDKIVHAITCALSSYCLCNNAISFRDSIDEKVIKSNFFHARNSYFAVSEGEKPMRVLSKFIAFAEKQDFPLKHQYDFNKIRADFERLRLAHSQVLNCGKLKGTLCLSIHPMDYMTMSDNNCDWSSCMSWCENGCYHAGTVEMMNSRAVIVAYLESDTEYFPCGTEYNTWSNKKWRELFIVDPGFIAGIKGYPYHHAQMEALVIEKLKKMIGAVYPDWTYEDEVRVAHGRMINASNTHHVTLYTNLMYNDTEHNDFSYVCANNGHFLQTHARYTYSGVAYCMECGEAMTDTDCTSSVICEECSGLHRCYECGEYHDENDMSLIDGNWYCQYCAERCFETCDDCEDELLSGNLTAVYAPVINPYLQNVRKVLEEKMENGEYISERELDRVRYNTPFHGGIFCQICPKCHKKDVYYDISIDHNGVWTFVDPDLTSEQQYEQLDDFNRFNFAGFEDFKKRCLSREQLEQMIQEYEETVKRVEEYRKAHPPISDSSLGKQIKLVDASEFNNEFKFITIDTSPFEPF